MDQQEQVDGAAEEGSGDDQEDGQREDGLESIGRRCEQVERAADSLHSALVLADDRRQRRDPVGHVVVNDIDKYEPGGQVEFQDDVDGKDGQKQSGAEAQFLRNFLQSRVSGNVDQDHLFFKLNTTLYELGSFEPKLPGRWKR